MFIYCELRVGRGIPGDAPVRPVDAVVSPGARIPGDGPVPSELGCEMGLEMWWGVRLPPPLAENPEMVVTCCEVRSLWSGGMRIGVRGSLTPISLTPISFDTDH